MLIRLAFALSLATTALAAPTAAPAPLQQDAPGVREYTLSNAHGLTVRFLNLGAIVSAVLVPDRKGHLADVVLGYGSTGEYLKLNDKNRFGALVGRYAGRIAGARFTVAGKTYSLTANDGPNALHGGGGPGLDSQLWQVRQTGADTATLTLVSPDGAQGFPGRLTLTVTYRLGADDALHIDYRARSSRTTVLNLTNHSYFNLAGTDSGSVAGQRLRIAATRWIETDPAGIPTGRFLPVAGTPLDFGTPHAIGERIDARAPMMAAKGGYNHGWLTDGRGLRPVAWLADPASGRTLTISTTEPMLQAYTGDYIDGLDRGPTGKPIHPRDGIALETQHLSDSPHRPAFPTTTLAAGATYRSTTVWRFGTGG